MKREEMRAKGSDELIEIMTEEQAKATLKWIIRGASIRNAIEFGLGVKKPVEGVVSYD